MRVLAQGALRVLTVALCVGCNADPSGRPFDTVVSCRDPDAPPIDDLEQASTLIDTDGDGTLTDADLRKGEARVVLSLAGVHEATGQPSESGVSVHSDFDTVMYVDPRGPEPRWGIEADLNWLPVGVVFLWFQSEDVDLDVGAYPVTAMGFGVQTHEVGSSEPEFGDVPEELSGTIHITDVSDDVVSGYFEGRATTTLYSMIPERQPTGQEVTVEALAFREAPFR